MAKTKTAVELIREKTLGRERTFRFKIFKYHPPIYSEVIEDGEVVGLEHIGYEEEPIKVGVRQPSLRERNALVKGSTGEDGELDSSLFIVNATKMLTFDPETREPIYNDIDVEQLLDMPAGEFPDQFSEHALALLSLGVDDEKNFTSSNKTPSNKVVTN